MLQDDADLAAHPHEVEVAQLLPVVKDAAGLRRLEAEQQPQQRRLAGAGAADDGDMLARPYLEVHPREHRRDAGLIGEGQARAFDVAAQPAGVLPAGRHLRFGLQDRAGTLHQGLCGVQFQKR